MLFRRPWRQAKCRLAKLLAPPWRVYCVKYSPENIAQSPDCLPTIFYRFITVLDIFKRFSKNKKKIPQDTLNAIEHAEYPDKLIDLIAPHSGIRTEKKIELLGIQDTEKRLEQLAIFLESENEVLNIQNRISTKVKKRMERNQREYFLNEQLKEIKEAENEAPLISKSQLRLIGHLSRRFYTPVGEMVQAALPPSFSTSHRSRIGLTETGRKSLEGDNLDPDEAKILEALIKNTYTDGYLRTKIGIKSFREVIRSLEKRGFVEVEHFTRAVLLLQRYLSEKTCVCLFFSRQFPPMGCGLHFEDNPGRL